MSLYYEVYKGDDFDNVLDSIWKNDTLAQERADQVMGYVGVFDSKILLEEYEKKVSRVLPFPEGTRGYSIDLGLEDNGSYIVRRTDVESAMYFKNTPIGEYNGYETVHTGRILFFVTACSIEAALQKAKVQRGRIILAEKWPEKGKSWSGLQVRT